MTKRVLLVGIIGLGLVTSLFGSIARAADDSAPTGLVIDCDRSVYNTATGKYDITHKCTVDDFLNQFVVLAQWAMGLIAVLAVLMFVWGGFQFLTAGGRASKVDEGKRIILGTIVGLLISFSAYILINFTISAITGTSTTKGLNPFAGPIATIFKGEKIDNKNIERPFSGSTGSSGTGGGAECRQKFDNNCDNQVWCADPGLNGKIMLLQQQLNNLGCNCGPNVDGCFGTDTAACVRRFQIANQLSPTGMIVGDTKDLLESASLPLPCNLNAEVSARVQSVSAELPGFQYPSRQTGIGADGCCVVSKDIGGASQALFCADQTSERGCAAMGGKYTGGVRCQNDVEARQVCGFCLYVYSETSSFCFQKTGKYWCDSFNQPGNMSWQYGSCTNNSKCKPTNCSEGLFRTVP